MGSLKSLDPSTLEPVYFRVDFDSTVVIRFDTLI
jgi:hypothetical protein